MFFQAEWPWTIAFLLMLAGSGALFFGRKHYRVTLINMGALSVYLITVTVLCQLKSLPFIGIEMTKTEWMAFFSLSAGLMSIGSVLGYLVKKDVGLVFICIADSILVSIMIYMFFMAYTGIWYWIPGIACCLLACFAWLLTK